MPVYRNIQEFFFHIPKTGSTSVGRWFEAKNGGPGLIPRHHTPDQHLLACSKEELRDWPKHVVVRNTWDRIVSWYKYDMRNKSTGQKRKLTFEAFVGNMIATRDIKPRGIGSPQTLWVSDQPHMFVHRFERINRDFPGVERRNVSLDRSPYMDFYSEILAERVFDTYRDEIERFEFTFGG